MLGNSYFGFAGDGNSGGTISGGGTLNYIALFTPSGSQIGDSIMNQVNDPDDPLITDVQIAGNFIPDASGKNLGASTRRWGTLYMASVIDYATDLTFNSGGNQYFRMSTAGDFFMPNNKNFDVENTGSKILNIGLQYADVINIGTGLQPKTINVGSMTTLLDNINIYGNIFNQEVTNLLVKDKLFTVNDGGAVASGFNAGFQIEEGGVDTGWFMTNTTRDGWDFKAPAITGVATLGLDLLTANRTAKIQDASGTIAYLSDITGAINGTLNYVAMFTPNGNSVGDAPLKIGTITRAMPTTGVGANDSIAVGFDTTLNSVDSYTLGRGITVTDGIGAYIIGHTVNIDDIGDPFSSGGNLFSLGSIFTITGGANCDAIINVSFASTITATSQTRGVYLFGDSHICNDFVTYSTLIGESCNFTRVDHSTALGIFTNLTDVTLVYTFGEGNVIDNSNSITNFGTYNYISASTNLTVVGNYNTITDSDKLYLGNSNKNVVVDGITGYVGIGTTTPLAYLQIDGATSGGEKLISLNSTSYPEEILSLTQGAFNVRVNSSIFKPSGVSGTGGDASITIYSELGSNPTLSFYTDVVTATTLTITGSNLPLIKANNTDRIHIDSSVGVGVAATTDIRLLSFGQTSDSTTYSFQAQNSSSDTLFSVRNDGFVGVGTASPTEKFEIFDITAPFALKAFINNSLSSGYAELMMTTDISDMRFGAGGSGATPYGGSAGDCYFGAVSYSNLILATNNTVRMNIRNDGEVGIGTLNDVPDALFHVRGVSATGLNQTLEPVLGVTEDLSGATVNTIDDTTTTLYTIPIPTDKVVMVEARVVARKTAGTGVGTINDGNGYFRTATYANIAGTVSLSGAVQASYTGEGIAPFNVTLTISGTDVLVRVTGAVDDNVTWNCIVRTYEV